MQKFVRNKVATYCSKIFPYFRRYCEKPHRNKVRIAGILARLL
jgi:hypothetical protein